jgi:hypothetical protein
MGCLCTGVGHLKRLRHAAVAADVAPRSTVRQFLQNPVRNLRRAEGSVTGRGVAWRGRLRGRRGTRQASPPTFRNHDNWANGNPRHRRHGGLKHEEAAAERVQEQTQIIASAMGRAAPKAPTIISVNAESRFSSHCILRSNMPLLHRARRPMMNDQKKQLPGESRDNFRLQELACTRKHEAERIWLRNG